MMFFDMLKGMQSLLSTVNFRGTFPNFWCLFMVLVIQKLVLVTQSVAR